MDFETATASGNPPHSVKAATEQQQPGNKTVVRVTWKAPIVLNSDSDGVSYKVYRVVAPLNAASLANRKLVGTTSNTFIIDDKNITPSAIPTYLWFVVAHFDTAPVTVSRMSNTAKVP
jgi:hypothetical protein